MFLVAFDGQAFEPALFEIVSADDWKHRNRLGTVVGHAIRVKRLVDREGAAVSTGNAGDGGVEAARVFVPYRHAATDVEAGRVLYGYLFLAVIAVADKRRTDRVGFAQDCLAAGAAHRDVRAQMQGVAHQVGARADLHRAATERGDVIHCGLQRTIIAANNLGSGLGDRDAWALFHRRMHASWKLPFVRRRGEVIIGNAHRGRDAECQASEQREKNASKHRVERVEGCRSNGGGGRNDAGFRSFVCDQWERRRFMIQDDAGPAGQAQPFPGAIKFGGRLYRNCRWRQS